MKRAKGNMSGDGSLHFERSISNFAWRGYAALAFARKSLATWVISGDQCIVTAISGGR